MQFFFVILLACSILFLFRLYHLANDDYVLMKKNISLEDVFNAAFVIFAISLLSSRLAYVLINPSEVFSNPLGFLLFPYFPGLSSTGAIIGGAIALFLYSRRKHIPYGRIFDFFSLSLVFVLPFGMIGYMILSQEFTTGNIVKLIIYAVMLAASNIYLYPKASSLEIKDGTISGLFLVLFSLVSLLSGSIEHPGVSYFLSHRENFVLFTVLICGIVLILKQEIIGRISFKNGK